MAKSLLTISDEGIEAFHPDFVLAVVNEWSKRAKEGASGIETRQKVRLVVQDATNRTIAVLHKTLQGSMELPGGGRERKDGKLEPAQAAARRELRQETGLQEKQILSIERICKYREIRKRVGLQIEGICYLVTVKDRLLAGAPELSLREEEAGMTVLWLHLDEAIAKIASQTHNTYTAAFDRYCNLRLLTETFRHKAAKNFVS